MARLQELLPGMKVLITSNFINLVIFKVIELCAIAIHLLIPY